MRAGLDSVSRGQIEAGQALGLTRWQIFLKVELFQALAAVFPAISSQFILLLLASSLMSTIGSTELTGAANDIQSRFFRSFEVYIVATILYFVMALGFSAVFAMIERYLFQARRLSRGHPDAFIRVAGFVSLALAIRWTVLLSVIGMAGGGALGLCIALGRTAKNRTLRTLCALYIRIFQSTPLLMQLFLVYFGISIFGVSVDPLTAASISLVLNAAAFLGDIWRGCIESVPRGQSEAAQALALKTWQRVTLVILPQAFNIAIPPTVVYVVQLIKNTSLASIIGFVELTRTGQIINNATFQPFLVFSLVAAFYFALCWPISWSSKKLERRVAGR